MKKKHPRYLVSYLILTLMSEGPRYGYDLLDQLKEISGGFWEPSYGTVYGALERFEKDGLIERVEGEHKNRKYFELTEKGRERLRALEKEEEEIREKLRDIAEGFLHIYDHLYGMKETRDLMEKIEKDFLDD